MGNLALIQLVVFLLGLVVAGYFLRLIQRNRLDVVLRLLGVCLVFWFGLRFIDVGLRTVFDAVPPLFLTGIHVLSYTALLLESPLLLLALLRYRNSETGEELSPGFYVLLFLPAAAAVPAGIGFLRGGNPVGSGWELPLFLGVKTSYALAISTVCWFLYRATDRREIRYFSALFPVILLLTYLMVWWGYGTGALVRDSYVKIIVSEAPLVPLLFFFWTVYRYNILSLELKNQTILAFAAVATMFLYYVGIRTFSHHLQTTYQINPDPFIVASLLVLLVGLVVSGRWMTKLTGSSVRRETLQSLEDLADRLSRPDFDVDRGISLISDCLEEALGASCEVLRDSEDELFRLVREMPDRPLSVLEEEQERFQEVVRNRGGRVVVPLRTDDALTAVLLLGRRRQYLGYTPEELEGLSLVMKQFRVAERNRRLLRDRLELERQLQQEETFSALGNVAASVAHEVKNPLSSIKAIVDQMGAELDPESDHGRDVKVVRQEVDRLQSIVENVLSFSRRGREDVRSVEVTDLVKGVLYVLGKSTEEVRIDTRMPEGDVRARTSTFYLKGILFNLLQNALEAAPAGTSVRVDVEQEDKHLQIRIRNDGEPMPEEARERLVSGTGADPFDRSGFGLDIVREDMSEIPGSLDVETGEDWTEVTISLPAVNGTDGEGS